MVSGLIEKLSLRERLSSIAEEKGDKQIGKIAYCESMDSITKRLVKSKKYTEIITHFFKDIPHSKELSNILLSCTGSKMCTDAVNGVLNIFYKSEDLQTLKTIENTLNKYMSADNFEIKNLVAIVNEIGESKYLEKMARNLTNKSVFKTAEAYRNLFAFEGVIAYLGYVSDFKNDSNIVEKAAKIFRNKIIFKTLSAYKEAGDADSVAHYIGETALEKSIYSAELIANLFLNKKDLGIEAFLGSGLSGFIRYYDETEFKRGLKLFGSTSISKLISAHKDDKYNHKTYLDTSETIKVIGRIALRADASIKDTKDILENLFKYKKWGVRETIMYSILNVAQNGKYPTSKKIKYIAEIPLYYMGLKGFNRAERAISHACFYDDLSVVEQVVKSLKNKYVLNTFEEYQNSKYIDDVVFALTSTARWIYDLDTNEMVAKTLLKYKGSKNSGKVSNSLGKLAAATKDSEIMKLATKTLLSYKNLKGLNKVTEKLKRSAETWTYDAEDFKKRILKKFLMGVGNESFLKTAKIYQNAGLDVNCLIDFVSSDFSLQIYPDSKLIVKISEGLANKKIMKATKKLLQEPNKYHNFLESFKYIIGRAQEKNYKEYTKDVENFAKRYI